MSESTPPLEGTVLDKPEATPAPIDYFGLTERVTHYLPDGQQYFVFQPMNEGAKSKFQKLTQRDVVVERQSGNARMRVNPAEERHALIINSVVDFNLYRGGAPIPYTDRALKDVLELFPPHLIEDLEKAIRKANPWLISEQSLEDVDAQIKELEELREQIKERDAGEAGSGSK